MASPWNSTITVDGTSFKAYASEVSIFTDKDEVGVPTLGTQFSQIRAWVDADNDIDFSGISHLFTLSNIVSQEQIVDMKVEFWRDESQSDAVCTFSFKGWIAKFSIFSPTPGSEMAEQANHVLYVELEPEVNESHFKEIVIGN